MGASFFISVWFVDRYGLVKSYTLTIEINWGYCFWGK